MYKKIQYRLLLLLLLFATALPAQQSWQGTQYDEEDKASKINYTVTETTMGDMFQSQYRVFNGQKRELFVVVVVNDTAAHKYTLTVKTNNLTQTITKTYDPRQSGLFYSNRPDMDSSMTLASATDTNWHYLISFRDSSRTSPFLHKIISGNTMVLLDEISAKRLARHKEYLNAIINNNLQANQLKLRQQEQERKAKRQQEILDSIAREQLIEMQKREADSLQKEVYIHTLLSIATDFYKSWQSDTEAVVKKYRQVIYDYQQAIPTLKSTVKDKEWYSGSTHRRKKQGSGFLVIDHLTFYDGQFEEDSFSNGLGIVQGSTNIYVGDFIDKKRDGIGCAQYKNGNYLLGVFNNGQFENGASNWQDNTGKHYFGQYSRASGQTGYGEIFDRGSIYIGTFSNGELVNGYARTVNTQGGLTYWKYENKLIQSEDARPVEKVISQLAQLKANYSIAAKDTSITLVESEQPEQSTAAVSSSQTAKYKSPHYLGVTFGCAIPALGFNQSPTYTYPAPLFAIDGWFRFANAIGFRLKLGCSLYSVGAGYSDNVRYTLQNTIYIPKRYDMLWFVHYYNGGLGLRLGGRIGSFELGAMAGLAFVHQPIYNYKTDRINWDIGRFTWNFQGEAAIRINCTKKFGFRFGATYFLSHTTGFNGYAKDGEEFISSKYMRLHPVDVWLQSINPFVSFVGLF